MAERLGLRLPEGTKERWKEQADAQGVSLTEFVVRRVESDPIATTISSEIEGGFARLESLVIDLLETPPTPEDYQPTLTAATSLPPSLPVMIFPRPFGAQCENSDMHQVGVPCSICGGNGLMKPQAVK